MAKLKLFDIDPHKYSHLAYTAIQGAYMEAKIRQNEFFTPEHILHEIAMQKRFADVAHELGIDLEHFVDELDNYLNSLDRLPTKSIFQTEPSSFLTTLLDSLSLLLSDKAIVNVFDIILCLSQLKDSYAAYALNSIEGVPFETLLHSIYKNYDGECAESDVKPGMYDADDRYDFHEINAPELSDSLASPEEIDEDVSDTEEQDFEPVGDDDSLSDEKITKKTAQSASKRKNRHVVAGSPEDIISKIPGFQGISITFGLAGKMLENIAAQQMGGNPQQKQQEGQRSHRKDTPQREPWEDMVTCVNDIWFKKNRLIGREAELDRTIEVLCRKDKNNPLHIGESGVGKTAIIYGLAQRIEEGNVPDALQGYRIYMMDMGSMVAGASYHGEFERRIKEIMEGMLKRGNCIVYIDEIHNIMGTGAANNGPMDAANLLKPYLEDGTIRFIGSTTYQEYNRYMANSKSIARRFQQIDILEPSIDETIDILNGILHDYEAFHHVRYEQDAVRYAVEQSAKLIADRFLPDKAIDIIDEAGAYRKTHPLYNKKGELMSPGRQKVDRKLISDVLTKVCKINAKALAEEDNSALRNLAERISGEIYGQDEAVKQVVRAIKMSKAGLTMGDKPLASLLFVGPTGVGKTEVCKVLAKEMGMELVRFDMSEYTEKHTVAKLIGSPAGYVGYDDGGLLTDAIRKTPSCVLLLDEIEKAHSDIYNILLQVMDYARLTDNKGNKVDFRKVVLIMTSNAGAQYAGQASIGFGGGQSKGGAMLQTIKKTFKPEFLNRLTGTVVFNDMDKKMASLILEKKLRDLQSLLDKHNVTMNLSDEARSLLLEKGFTTQYGAREIDRVIQSMLTPLFMDEILFGKLKKGGIVTVNKKGEALELE